MTLRKHLPLRDRFFIAKPLDDSVSLKSIALELSRVCTTILKEVRAHKVFSRTVIPGKTLNNCALFYLTGKKRVTDFD